MKKAIIISCIAAVSLLTQEKSTIPVDPRPASVSNRAPAPFTYAASDVKVLGDLDFGKSSGPVFYSTSQPYSAFVFSAFGGETVDIAVKGIDRKAMVALADASLQRLAIADTRIHMTLPYRGPYIECWYIIFRDFEKKPAQFAVQVNKVDKRRLQDLGNTAALQ